MMPIPIVSRPPAPSLQGMRLLAAATVLLTGLLSAQPLRAADTDLVLLVVVDQLRGDMPQRFRQRFEAGGFRYLMENGVVYADARFRHASTLTAPGHATLATGSNPAQHGIVANEWYDPSQGRVVNCVEDRGAPLLGRASAATEGRSPRHLKSSTFGDELVLATAGQSRVFGVSLKDRGAILLAGFRGKAYWYDETTGAFNSSRYYHERLPEWAQRWNADRPADRYRETQWALLHERAAYRFGAVDDRPFEKPEAGHGRSFPHPLAHANDAVYYDSLRYTPVGDRLTLAFVEALVEAEQPGRRGVTDVLAVSFSSTDYVGHAFGPFSLEAEDNLLRLDAVLAELFGLIDRTVGLERTLVVLTADHGVAAAPEFLAAQGFDAGRLDPERFVKSLDASLRERFEVSERLLLAFAKPGLYLDDAAMLRLGLEPAQVERALVEAVPREPGFAAAYARSDLLAARLTPTPEAVLVRAGFHPGRSGHVYVVQAPFWFLGSEPDSDAATHGSPYAYDTHVPLMFAGPGVVARRVLRPVAPRDLAPTLSAWLGVAPPSGSVGTILEEVLEGGKKEGP